MTFIHEKGGGRLRIRGAVQGRIVKSNEMGAARICQCTAETPQPTEPAAGGRQGIAVAGNILTDIVKTVRDYPAVGMLATIEDVCQAVGGCVPNTAIDLARIDPDLPVSAIGRVGKDGYGDFVLDALKRPGIDCAGVRVSPRQPTSFSDVISLASGERTFYHFRGANREFSPADVAISSLTCRILHIGYILLLDAFDAGDPEYGTVMARFLHGVQAQGIKTSIDTVSDSTAHYPAKLLPALRYCHYVIINEIECSLLSGLPPYQEDGGLHLENIRKSMTYIAAQGVREKVIVHCKEAGFCYDVATEQLTVVPSLQIPPEKIRGSVGAGDAFCAGSLYALYNGYDDRRLLEFASAAAASSLFSENSTDGMLDRAGIEALSQKYGRKKL